MFNAIGYIMQSTNVKMMLMYLFLFGLFGSTIAEGNISDTKPEYLVPEIQGCTYENAHSVLCWWNRQQGDTSTQYRLAYLSASDAFHERREKICDMTQQTVEGNVIVESCKFKGSMYGQFTIYVTSVDNCDETNMNCESTGRKSESITYTCTSNNVEITIPPGGLDIETTTYLLMWNPPDKDSSMLSFVLNRRHVLYKVEYREVIDGNTDIEWEEWYSGYETSVFLPTLIAGSMYEVQVSASLDPPKLRPTAERKWTKPSNILVFLVPREINSQHMEEKLEVDATLKSEQTLDEEPTENIPRRQHMSRQVVIASAVSSLTIVIILAVIGFFIPWKRLCCLSEAKISKPIVFISLSDDDIEVQKEKGNFQDESNRDTKGENPFPITQLLNIDERSFKQTSIRSNTSNIRYLTFHRENNSTVSDYARQRLLSPEKMADENFSVIESVSQDNVMNAAKNDVTSARNDIIIERDHHGWNMSQSKQELRTLLKNCGALDKDMASPELHRCNKEENKEFIPSYIISAGMKSDTSYNRSTSEYVIDSTGMDSLLTSDMHDDMNQEEKHKQWQKYIMDSQCSDDESDIPDYVTHAPSQSKDFCQNMNIFVSMATEDLNKRRRPLGVCEGQCAKSAKLPRSDSNHIIVMTVCTSCKNSTIHETCDNAEGFSDLKNDFLSITVPPTRRGSVSDNSVDSGYSPDSPDCVTAASRVKENVLNSQFDMRSTVGDNNESDNDDYMRYVTS